MGVVSGKIILLKIHTKLHSSVALRKSLLTSVLFSYIETCLAVVADADFGVVFILHLC